MSSTPPVSTIHEARPDSPEWDPVYLHAKRETGVIIGLFLLFFSYSITLCWFLGYPSGTEVGQTPKLILGMPAWVFWGIFVPWIVVDVVAYWFCFHFMVDDPLDDSVQGDSVLDNQEETDSPLDRDISSNQECNETS